LALARHPPLHSASFIDLQVPMSVQLLIPTPLQKFTQNEASVDLDAASVEELLHALEERFPGILERICDAEGKLRRFLNVYVNGEDIRFLAHKETVLNDGDEVSIVPAVAGG
jgi:molybdopterin synthase sulfur carrier subunit